MASGFKWARTSSLVNTGDFVPLSATRLSQSPTSLKLLLKAGADCVIRIDAAAGGGDAQAIASEMVMLTGVPSTPQWTEVGAIDPSRVWIRSGTTALADHVYWVASWI